MASSVARMPSADGWRGSSDRLAGDPFLPHINLKVRVRLHTTTAAAVAGDDEDKSPAAATSSRRQCRILDMWASRREEIIAAGATVERKVTEAEISALATATQPVSARAATFLSDRFSGAGAGGGISSVVEVPPSGVRASSLIQMWRELEADSGISSPTSRGGALPLGSDSSNEDSGRSTASGSQQAPPASEQVTEKSRVGDIVRMLSLANGGKILRPESPPPAGDERRRVRARGRCEMEQLLAQMQSDRWRELAAMAERRPVSRFSHRGRIQSLIRLNALRREASVEACDRRRVSALPPLSEMEPEQLESRTTISHLRQKFIHGSQQEGRSLNVLGSSNATKPPPHETTKLLLQEEEGLAADSASTASSSEDMLEGARSPDIEWEDRSLNPATAGADSTIPSGWQREEDPAEEPPNPFGNGHLALYSRRTDLTRGGFGESPSYNVEILELLERKRVSTSLAGEFRHKMEQVIMSFLQAQEQRSLEGDFEEGYGELPSTWRRGGDGFLGSHATASSSSSSPAPPRYLMFPDSDNWQHTSLGMDSSCDLRGDFTQIYREICELRKLVDGCLQWQANLQLAIRQEVSAAVCQSVCLESSSPSSNQAQTRKGSCCICCEMQVDSLLYRCGHMCTCFKCAHELQWRSGRCPICRAPIDDVVRTFSNS